MKQISFAFTAILMLLALVAVPHAATFAADATCVADPSAGPIGTDFKMTCWGYTPNTYVYAYLVEPAGVATTLITYTGEDRLYITGALKADANGYVNYTQPSAYQPFATLATGTWGFVAEETGLAKAVIHRGETKFTITGGTEDVHGASLSADPATINKPVQGYDHFALPPPSSTTVNLLNVSEPVTLSGSGFLPGEMVSFWVEPAGGGCPSSTIHKKYKLGTVISGIASYYAIGEDNIPVSDSFGAQALTTVKATSSGNATARAFFTPLACEGVWRFVARGNTSGAGAEAHVTVIGNLILTTAFLAANPSTVSALYAPISFSGSGFTPNETVSCWLTSPRGQTLGFPHDEFFTVNTANPSGVYIKNQSIAADSGGNVSFDMLTGSSYTAFEETFTIGGVPNSSSGDLRLPLQSEGALGEWAMTCRGFSSNAAAIARFNITGGFIDP